MLFTPLVFTFFNIYASIRVKGLQAILLIYLGSVYWTFILGGLRFLPKLVNVFPSLVFYLDVERIILPIMYRCCVLLFLRFMRSHGLNECRVVIFGAGESGERFAGTVQQALWTRFPSSLNFIDDDAQHKPASLHHIPVLKTPCRILSAYLAKEKILMNSGLLCLCTCANARAGSVIWPCVTMTITMRFVVGFFGLDFIKLFCDGFAGFPVLNIRSTPMIGLTV